MADHNKRAPWLPIVFSIVLVVGIFIGYELRDKTGYGSILSKPTSSSVAEVLKLIQSKYVDDVALDSINTNVINDLLASLDPHSSYIPADELAEVNDELMGNFQGIGIEYQMINDSLNIITVLPDGPAKKAGLLTGDICLKANDSIKLSGGKVKPEQIRKYLRGLNGSNLKISVLRNGKLKDFNIQRSVINLPSVDATYLVDSVTGYIHVNKFTEQTHLEFMKSLDTLNKQHIAKLIVDLRGNGGGLMDAAAQIADEFLTGEKIIVYTEGVHSKRINYTCKKDGMFEEGKLVVLVDETSASASEVLTGALQDWDRATIVGRRSFGKGLVQQQFMLSDGSAVRLTTAKYYTPLGRNIQKPYHKDKEQYKEEIFNRYHHNSQQDNYDSFKLIAKTFKTPKGHIVYGGGGITPDFNVPFDTTIMHTIYAKLMANDMLNIFSYHWYLSNINSFSGAKDYKSIQQILSNNKTWWSEVQTFAHQHNIEVAGASEKDKQRIRNNIESFIAHILINKSASTQIMNQDDATVLKAIELLK